MDFRSKVIPAFAFGIPDSNLGAQFREKWAPFYFSDPSSYHQAQQELEAISLKERCAGLIPVVDGRIPEPKLCVFDVDSTLIENEMIDEMARICGVYDQVSAITESAMRGEIDFNQALEQRLECLKSFSKAHLTQVRKCIKLRPGLDSLLHEFKLMGAHIAFASGGFDFIVGELKTKLGADHFYCHTLAWNTDETLNGLSPSSPRVDGEAKAHYIKRLQQQLNISTENTWVFGDGSNDIPMMREASLKISVAGKPKLIAHTNVWLRSGDYRDLSVLMAML